MYTNFESFQLYCPSIAKEVVEYRDINDFEVMARLQDGSTIIYDSLDHAIRSLPRDSRNMTEQECRREFGMRLRRAMERKGITQEALAHMTGIQQSLISNYIRGRHAPSFYNADKIAKALDCSIDEFRYL